MARWLMNGRLAPDPYRAHIQPGRKSAPDRLVGTRFHTATFPPFGTCRKEREIARLEGHKSDTQLQGVTFSHDGRRIATVSLDGSARLWDGISGQIAGRARPGVPGLKLTDVAPDEHDQEMNSAFSRDDRLLATASFDGTSAHLGRRATRRCSPPLAAIAALVEHLEFSPVDNNILLTASHDGTARLWDIDGILTTTLSPRILADLRGRSVPTMCTC